VQLVDGLLRGRGRQLKAPRERLRFQNGHVRVSFAWRSVCRSDPTASPSSLVADQRGYPRCRRTLDSRPRCSGSGGFPPHAGPEPSGDGATINSLAARVHDVGVLACLAFPCWTHPRRKAVLRSAQDKEPAAPPVRPHCPLTGVGVRFVHECP
jgi:hypothetical protein